MPGKVSEPSWTPLSPRVWAGWRDLLPAAPAMSSASPTGTVASERLESEVGLTHGGRRGDGKTKAVERIAGVYFEPLIGTCGGIRVHALRPL
jgi:hypothetical protein